MPGRCAIVALDNLRRGQEQGAPPFRSAPRKEEADSMANKHKILWDKTEIIIQKAEKRAMTMTINEEDVTSIILEQCYIKGGFLGLKQMVSQQITFKTKRGMPGTVDKTAVENAKENWDDYLTKTREFAKRNRLSIYDKLDEPPQAPQPGSGMGGPGGPM